MVVRRRKEKEKGCGMVCIEVERWEGEIRLCKLFPRGECRDCPYITCNNHPQFSLVQMCVDRWVEARRREPSEGR